MTDRVQDIHESRERSGPPPSPHPFSTGVGPLVPVLARGRRDPPTRDSSDTQKNHPVQVHRPEVLSVSATEDDLGYVLSDSGSGGGTAPPVLADDVPRLLRHDRNPKGVRTSGFHLHSGLDRKAPPERSQRVHGGTQSEDDSKGVSASQGHSSPTPDRGTRVRSHPVAKVLPGLHPDWGPGSAHPAQTTRSEQEFSSDHPGRFEPRSVFGYRVSRDPYTSRPLGGLGEDVYLLPTGVSTTSSVPAAPTPSPGPIYTHLALPPRLVDRGQSRDGGVVGPGEPPAVLGDTGYYDHTLDDEVPVLEPQVREDEGEVVDVQAVVEPLRQDRLEIQK